MNKKAKGCIEKLTVVQIPFASINLLNLCRVWLTKIVHQRVKFYFRNTAAKVWAVLKIEHFNVTAHLCDRLSVNF